MPSDFSDTQTVSSNEASNGHIGIFTNSFESAYYSCIVESVSNFLTAHNFHLSVLPKQQSISSEREAFKSLDNGTCDGLIIHADRLDDNELNALMKQYPTAVMLDRYLPLFADKCVYADNKQGGEIGAQFLLAQGHTKIAMVRGPDSYIEVADRSAGFKSVLASKNIELQAELCGDFLHAGGEYCLEQIHLEHPDVTAVFCQNDVMAFGALKACRRLGIQVPEDLSILGLDGVPMCEYVSPRLTSVQKPLRRLGEHAAQIVSDLVSNVDINQRTKGTIYTPVLAERETVAQPTGYKIERVSLTKRETECLSWTAAGKTSWEISVILGISESTATFHLRNASAKLKASNRTHSVAKALHFGLIPFIDDSFK